MPENPDLPDLTSPRSLRLYLTERNLRLQRGRGQNFLVDGNVARKIVDAAELCSGDRVVEIGPGAGALTAILARRSMRVVALELDRGLAVALAEQLRPFTHVNVLQLDALKAKWAELNRVYFGAGAEVNLISNLPYNISGPFLHALFKQNFPFIKAVLMFQREVAARLIAEPGSPSYGALSVFCRYYAPAEMLFPVSRHVFWPSPKVDSAVVKMQPRHGGLDAGQEKLFRQIVQAAFQQRRKKLANSLGKALFRTREEFLSVIQPAGVDPDVRAETISMEQFAKIAQIAYNWINERR